MERGRSYPEPEGRPWGLKRVGVGWGGLRLVRSAHPGVLLELESDTI